MVIMAVLSYFIMCICAYAILRTWVFTDDDTEDRTVCGGIAVTCAIPTIIVFIVIVGVLLPLKKPILWFIHLLP